MATLNITYNGTSADYPGQGPAELSDHEIKRMAAEVVQNGEIKGLWLKHLPRTAFDGFVVDRIHSPHGGLRIYLRPKVPFGA